MKNIILKQIMIILSTLLIFNLVFLPISNASDVMDSFSSIDDFIEARKYGK